VFVVTTLSGDESIGNEACLHSSESVFVMTKCMNTNTTARLQMLVKKQLSKSACIHTFSIKFSECLPTDVITTMEKNKMSLKRVFSVWECAGIWCIPSLPRLPWFAPSRALFPCCGSFIWDWAGNLCSAPVHNDGHPWVSHSVFRVCEWQWNFWCFCVRSTPS